LIDLFQGSVNLVVDGITHPVAFGNGAEAFSIAEQGRQKILLTKQLLIPMFSLMERETELPEESSIMKINFGGSPFCYPVNCTALQSLHQQLSTKGIDNTSILDNTGGSNTVRDKIGQEEDEKINNVSLNIDTSRWKKTIFELHYSQT
jgi:hypothetical protein